jgi:hypothetical protein
LARRVIEEEIRIAPDGLRHDDLLSSAWERIAKAHWSLGQSDQALAALRESVAIQKQLFEREPTNDTYRASLSRCYDRSVFYGSQAGDFRGAADAILQRSRLWPANATQLTKSAEDFDALAAQVTARTRGQLSAEDQAEQGRYRAESRRMRQAAADAASRRSHPDLRVER